MSVSGRTVWWMKDCAWWRREVVVELGEEFGPVGPAVMDWLSSEAKQQSVNDGYVKTGYRALGRGVFTNDVDVVRSVVARAVELEALKDFEETGRTFTCRISGFTRDQERALATTRKQRQRDRESQPDEPNQDDAESVTPRDTVTTQRDGVTPEGDMSRFVTSREEESREESSLRSDTARTARDQREKQPSRAVDQDQLPDDLPPQLVPIAAQVLQRLVALYDQRGGYRPTLRGVGLALRRFPERDHLAVVADLEHWSTAGRGQNQQPKDWARTFASFLEKAPAARPAVAGASRFDARRGTQRGGEPCPNGTADAAAVAAWEAALPQLRDRLGDSFDVWVAPVHAHRIADGTLVLAAPAETVRWVVERFGRVIAAAVNQPVQIVACADSAAGPAARAA